MNTKQIINGTVYTRTKVCNNILRTLNAIHNDNDSWYLNANNIAKSMNGDVSIGAGVIAALSPKKKLES